MIRQCINREKEGTVLGDGSPGIFSCFSLTRNFQEEGIRGGFYMLIAMSISRSEILERKKKAETEVEKLPLVLLARDILSSDSKIRQLKSDF